MDDHALVIDLKELAFHPELEPEVGGKARALARLHGAGFPVPEAFCITAAAFYHFLDAIGSEEGKYEGIQAQVPGVAPVPKDLAGRILKSYRALIQGSPTGRVAVRSSALDEDGSPASFAGQYDTILNISSEAELLEAIPKVWASLWGDRARAYRSSLEPGLAGSPHRQSPLALPLMVQRMVPAVKAGVAFTVNPLNGAEELIIEAVKGLGENLASGKRTPDRWCITKDSLEIQEVFVSSPGTPVLTDDEVSLVSELALRAEHFSGSPQDVEWALGDDQVYLLQSRPVTGLGTGVLQTPAGQVDMAALLRRADDNRSEIWTDDNVSEVFPEPVTPLTWSVVEGMGNRAFHTFLRHTGVHSYPEQGLFGRFYGRVYFNQSQFQRLMSRFYISRLSRSAGSVLALAKTGLRALFWLIVLPVISARVVGSLPKKLERSPGPDGLSADDLLKEIERWRSTAGRLMELHLAVTIFAALAYGLLDKLVRLWGSGKVQPAHLVAGLNGLQSAEMGRRLAALADEAAAEPALAGCLERSQNVKLLECLEELPASSAFRLAFEAFLVEYGHASLQEFELAQLRWREDPAVVLLLLSAYHGKNKPDHAMEDGRKSRRLAQSQMRRRLGWMPKRLLFEPLLFFSQVYSAARENMKSTFVKAHGRLRDLYLALSDHLVHSGLIANSEDVFYLLHSELELLIAVPQQSRITVSDLPEKIASRRREHRRWREAGTAPKILEQHPNGAIRTIPAGRPPQVSGPAGRSQNSRMLHGVAASAGQVTGRVRVILDPSKDISLQPGEILVARSTNPAWSPLLLSAGALITEIGGLLSHGAIVAREYGLPAVLNVNGATSLLRTGQLIRVDGFEGTVSILE